MREVSAVLISETIKQLFLKANFHLREDILFKLKEYREIELSEIGCEILDRIIENAELASRCETAICQDTGLSIVFFEIGQDVHVTGMGIYDAVNEGVRAAYNEGYLRKSVVSDPLHRENTGDNTPAVIHFDIVQGDKIKIMIMPKGFGSENMSAIKMLKPSDGIEGVKTFVLETVKKSGSNPCPPIIVGVGIGGTFEKAAILAKKALLRPLTQSSSEEYYSKLEKELLYGINNLGLGPQGLGGITTALAVSIETYPTHFAGLPVAVNISCHASRHEEAVI